MPRLADRARLVCLVLLALAATTGCSSEPRPPDGRPTSIVAPGAVEPGATPPAPASPTGAVTPTGSSRAAAVVAWWDERRRRAWSSGDPAALHALYVPGSRAGEVDVAHLAAYVEAGVAIAGWQTQRRAVHELGRRGEVLTAVVTTRQRGATATLAGGVESASRRLPETAPRRLRVSLRWSGSFGWRVAEVRPVSPSAPTGRRAAPTPRRGGRS